MITRQLKSLTDLRNNPGAVGELARQLSEPVYILNRNKVEIVLMDIDSYEKREQLIDELQDQIDVAEIQKKRLTTKPEDFISHEKLMTKLGIQNS